MPPRLSVSRFLYALTALLSGALIWAYFTPTNVTDQNPIKIIAESGGRISTVYVKEGDLVRAGDPLIQLDTRELLLKRHFLESQIHLTELRGDSVRPGLVRLYRDLEQTNLELTRLTITSPDGGQITSVAPLRAEQILSAGTSVATLVPASDRDFPLVTRRQRFLWLLFHKL